MEDDVQRAINENWQEWGEAMGISYRDFGMIFEGGWAAYQASMTDQGV